MSTQIAGASSMVPRIKSASLEKIRNFRESEYEWGVGEDVPADPRVASRAEKIVDFAERCRWKTDVFLGDGGEILVTSDRGSFHFEFVVEINGTLTLIREDDNGQDVERLDGTDSDAFTRLLFPDPSWTTSAFSIRTNIGKTPKADLQGWRFETREALREYQSWNPVVVKPTADQYADILLPTITEGGRRLASIGLSLPQSYPSIKLSAPPGWEATSGATETFMVWTTQLAKQSSNPIAFRTGGRITEFASMEADPNP